MGEGFHSGRGAVREAQNTFVAPSELERFPPGSRLRVLEVCVGTGTNTAALLEACARLGLQLQWWGLELDPQPLALALADGDFRRQWQPGTLVLLEQLRQQGRWQGERGEGVMLLGDARCSVRELQAVGCGQLDLVWHDAFSPQRCPQLWSVEFLAAVAALLAPDGRWISYCSAAAVRAALAGAGLALAAIPIGMTAATAAGATADNTAENTPRSGASDTGAGGPESRDRGAAGRGSQDPGAGRRRIWSGGTVASPQPLLPSGRLRPLSAMEQEHLATSAALPYRDPLGTATAAAILAERCRSQAEALARGVVAPSSAWRRRWGVDQPAGSSGGPLRADRIPPLACAPIVTEGTATERIVSPPLAAGWPCGATGAQVVRAPATNLDGCRAVQPRSGRPGAEG